MAKKNKDLMTEHFSRYMTAYCMSKAILEDYSKVVAKLENIEIEEVKERVTKRTNEIFKEQKEKLNEMYENRNKD